MRRLLVALLATAGCGLGGSPTMQPGKDCLHCHDGGRARRWSLAGTVYGSADAARDAGLLDAHVTVRDASGWTFTLQTNEAGNFYSAESVAFPLQVCVEHGGTTACMADPVTSGACNACHGQPPTFGADGRIHVP